MQWKEWKKNFLILQKKKWINRGDYRLPNIYDEIFNYAKKYIQDKSKYSPSILKSTPPNQKFPLVLIKQIADDIYDENLDKTDQRFNIAYEIEIYTVNEGNIAKQSIANELMNLINDVFDEHYGMDRKMNTEAPNIDNDVYRWQMRFEAKLDERKIIYRR